MRLHSQNSQSFVQNLISAYKKFKMFGMNWTDLIFSRDVLMESNLGVVSSMKVISSLKWTGLSCPSENICNLMAQGSLLERHSFSYYTKFYFLFEFIINYSLTYRFTKVRIKVHEHVNSFYHLFSSEDTQSNDAHSNLIELYF